MKDVERVADDLSNLVEQLRREIRDNASFDRLVQLADEISEHADEAAGTFSTVNDALMNRLSEIKGGGSGSGNTRTSSGSSRAKART
ncbi:MAG: hypothetical protein AUG88_02235 [Actinobacteria bacterium 13_1_20CM_4_68_12]|nr:MAG: hypothetical protein AUG88_02235 [Actinobacteria bacterium 13_1_20CM_4_68_12]